MLVHQVLKPKGYELNIEDYLLKPFNFSRFVKSVSKVSDALANKPISLQNLENTVDTKIFIKEDKKYYQIKLKDIMFIEAYGNYVKVYMVDKMIVSHLTLTSFTHNLPESQFICLLFNFSDFWSTTLPHPSPPPEKIQFFFKKILK